MTCTSAENRKCRRRKLRRRGVEPSRTLTLVEDNNNRIGRIIYKNNYETKMKSTSLPLHQFRFFLWYCILYICVQLFNELKIYLFLAGLCQLSLSSNEKKKYNFLFNSPSGRIRNPIERSNLSPDNIYFFKYCNILLVLT